MEHAFQAVEDAERVARNRAYQNGWNDRNAGRDYNSNHPMKFFYQMGWSDAAKPNHIKSYD